MRRGVISALLGYGSCVINVIKEYHHLYDAVEETEIIGKRELTCRDKRYHGGYNSDDLDNGKNYSPNDASVSVQT